MTMISMRFDNNSALIKTESPFVTRFFDENFDGDKLAVLCENSIPLDNLRRKDARNQVILEKYLNQSYKLQNHKLKKTCHRTSYEQNEDLCTRVQAQSSSAQGMLREARHFIFCESHIDFDMINAHPRIILQLCRELNLACPNLMEYVASREHILAGCQKKSGKSREHYKTLFLSLMYGKSIDNVDKFEDEFIFKFAEEFKGLAKEITDAFPEFKETCIKQRKERGKDYNHDSATLSHLCQCFESKFLDIMFEKLLEKSPKHSGKSIPCFDGLMIHKDCFSEKFTSDEYIRLCEEAVGLPDVFQLEKKSMQKMHDIVLEAYGYSCDNKDEHITRYLKDQRLKKIREYKKIGKTLTQEFLHEPQTNVIDFVSSIFAEYEVWPDREMFEEYFAAYCNRYFANVLSRPGTFVCNISKNIVSEQKLPNASVSWHGSLGIQTTQLHNAVQSSVLVNKIRKYNDIGCFPSSPVQPARTMEGVFNTFVGIQAQYTKVTKKSNNLELVLSHIFNVLSNGDDEVFDYILVWLSTVFRNPGWPSKRCLIFHSKAHQIGKGIMLNFLVEKVFGTKHGQVRKNASFLSCNFNKELENSILNLMDEVPELTDFTDGKAITDRFKSYITEPHIEIIGKGETPKQRANSNNFIVTSNDDNPIHIDPNDKRFFKVKCGEMFDGNSKYFERLAKAMTQETADELYSYCFDYNSKYDRHVHDQPQTESLIQSKEASQTNAVKFISHLHDLIKDGLIFNGDTFEEKYVNDNVFGPLIANYEDVKGKVRISSRYLYPTFERWAKEEGIKKIVKKSNFMNEIEDCKFVKNSNISRVLHALIDRD